MSAALPPPPAVSVLLGAVNAARWLDPAMESIRAQTGVAWELLAADDGSTDDTFARLERHAREDARVRLFRWANRGLAASLNELARHARAPFFARMDADDLCEPGRFAQQAAFLAAHPEVAAVGGQALRVDADEDVIGPWNVPLDHEAIDRLHLSGHGGGIIHPAAMIRRGFFEQVGGYDGRLTAAQDYDLWLKLAEVGRLANLPENILRYRVHLGAVSLARRDLQARCGQQALEAAARRRGLPPPAPNAFVRGGTPTPERYRRQWVRMAARAGHGATARKHAAALLREQPWSPLNWLHWLLARRCRHRA